ncbi:MAG: type II secretion system GspH family protein [Proteobacteria bacterium]|nr:type II secretion system GspH family protein [Pseudomonadota bacterium]MBU1583760.1 type II secretion system GspH family protein [Pseudomonadota bacterium]MBU2453329.1 type II secretion system GspH family protein [Pseudomonadota bacterium]MBU2630233.1 type II secretion system GspH family protein [Pseudomonadota bacterium]
MNTKGFTLIEVIVSIVMIGMATAMLINFFNAGLTHSSDPLDVLNDNYAALTAIETVNADYRRRLELNASQAISIYAIGDLSALVNGLASGVASGQATSFNVPDAQRRVNELAAPGNLYVKVTATRNNSTLVTLLGN